MLFRHRGEGEALEYLKKRVPHTETDRDIDQTPFQTRLFEVPDKLLEGKHEFKAENVLVSFTLVDVSRTAFDRCYTILQHKKTEGSFQPIYEIRDLRIQTKDTTYDGTTASRRAVIYWLPDVHGVGEELGRYVDITNARIYLTGEQGKLSRPIDLMALFHEIGHIETRTPTQINEENLTVETIISAKGVQTERAKESAYELQRERDADAWLLQKQRALFADIGISAATMEDYIHQIQLKSYHEGYRRDYPDVVLSPRE